MQVSVGWQQVGHPPEVGHLGQQLLLLRLAAQQADGEGGQEGVDQEESAAGAVHAGLRGGGAGRGGRARDEEAAGGARPCRAGPTAPCSPGPACRARRQLTSSTAAMAAPITLRPWQP